MKITKTISKEFFKLIKDEKTDHFDQLMEMLKQYPELANGVVRGMSKGTEGFSSLMLAVRFCHFSFGIELIKAGADVNYIDDSRPRQSYYPVFFDLLEMLKDLIEDGSTKGINAGISLWEVMESHGLDYSKKSIVNDGLNKSDNCLEAFIGCVSTKYGNKHKIHKEDKYDPYERTYHLNEKSRDLEKEKWYDLIAEKIVSKMDESLVKKMDANRHRNSGNVFETSPGKHEIIDYFGLELANKYVKQRFGYAIKNMDDISFMDDYKPYAWKTFR